MQRITVLVLLAGCATSLSQRASMVRWTERREDVAGCRFLGVVDGTSRQTGIANEGIGRNNARNEALEEAARRGATHVRWIGNDESFSAIRVTAETYDCSVQQPPSTAPAPAPVSTPPEPAPSAARWWCVTTSDRDSTCWDDRGRCEAMRADDLRADPGTSLCTPVMSAICFRLGFPGIPGLAEVESCHDSPIACRAHRDFANTHSDQPGRPLTECRALEQPDPGAALLRRPETATAPAPARWWCVTIPGPNDLGTCENSVEACERTRADFVRAEPGISPCLPRAVAVCFRLVYPRLGEIESCHTNVTACRSVRDSVASRGDTTVLTDCRDL